MSSLWGNSNKIVKLYEEHTDKVEDCLEKFIQTINLYLDKGNTETVQEVTNEVHELESNADEIRRKIIHLLIQKSFLLPNTRRDFLNLLEYLDKVADYAEAALDYVILQSMDISNIGRKKLQEIMELTLKQYNLLQKAIDQLFNNINNAYDLVAQIEELESQVDDIERNLIARVSRREDLNFGLKVLYRDFVTMIANISDVIEDAGDEIELIIAMRKV